MPAVTPAEVATLPLLMKIGSGSTVRSGYRAASSALYAQWVVTRLPCSSPAAASRNVPVQTDAIRSASRAWPASHRTRAGSAWRAPWPPGTSSRSQLPVSSRRSAAGVMVSLLDVVTGRPPRLAVVTSYAAPALANTSSGPVTSRLCTPSNKTISTVRGTSPSVPALGHGSNDEYPTFAAIARAG